MSKINVSVDCVIFGFDNEEKKLKVLLIKKKINPYDKNNGRKQIALPGDLIRLEENIDESAKRVLFSLTKLNNVFFCIEILLIFLLITVPSLCCF